LEVASCRLDGNVCVGHGNLFYFYIFLSGGLVTRLTPLEHTISISPLTPLL